MLDAFFRHRGLILVGLLGLVAGAVTGLAKLRFDFSPQVIFQSSAREYEHLEELYEKLGRQDNTIVVLVESDDVLADASFSWIESLRARLAAVDGVEGARGIGQTAAVLEGRLLPVGLSELDSAQQRREAVASSPLIRGRMVSEDHRATLLFISLESGRMVYEKLRPLVEDVRQIVESLERPPGLRADVSGVPIVRVSLVQRMLRDQAVFFPTMALLLVALLGFLFRDWRAILVPLAAVLLAELILFGTMGHAGQEVNVLNNVLTSLVFVIGLSDAIHLLSRYREELLGGREREAALRRTLRHLAVACFLTSFTSAIGFASLVAARLDILAAFGLWAAAGVLIAYLVTICFLPLALGRMRATLSDAARGVDRWTGRASLRLGEWVMRRPRTIAVSGFGVAAVCALLGTRVGVDSRLFEAFDRDDPVVQLNERLEEHFHGVLPFSIAFQWEEGADPLHPEFLEYLRRWRVRVDGDPRSGGAFSVADLIAEWSFAATRSARSIPSDPALTRAALDQVERSLAQSGQAQVLDEVYAPDHRILRLRGWTQDLGLERLEALFDEWRGQLRDDRARLADWGVRARLTGDGPVANEALDRLITDLLKSLLLAFVFIFVTMVALLRSLRLALISLVPNVLPLLLTLGFMGALGMDLQVTSVIVFSISLGLAVDDTIHFMARYREEARRRSDLREILRRTYRGTGRAIVITTLVLGLGFSVLLLSSFPPTRIFAGCLVVTVFGALLADLLLLPACLQWFARGNRA